MPNTTITADRITDAIAAGAADIFTIAAHLGVNHTSYNLRARINLLINNGTIAVTGEAPDGTKFFTNTR